jgi:hypothetical protein
MTSQSGALPRTLRSIAESGLRENGSVGRVAVGRPLQTAPRADRDERLEKHPAPRSGHRGTCGAVCHSAYRTRFPGPVSGVWKRSNDIALAPLPSLHLLRLDSDRFVRRLRRYYAAVRLPGRVYRRRSVTPLWSIGRGARGGTARKWAISSASFCGVELGHSAMRKRSHSVASDGCTGRIVIWRLASVNRARYWSAVRVLLMHGEE